MGTYVVLAKFTEQGIRNAKDSPKRADAFKEMARTFGVTVKDIVWTQGRYDIVTIVEASDEVIRHVAELESRRARQRPHRNAASLFSG